MVLPSEPRFPAVEGTLEWKASRNRQDDLVQKSRLRGLERFVGLEDFVDGLMAAQHRDYHIAGSAVAIVKDGCLLLSKGYGLSHIAQRTAVDADQTLFRPGSVSKLFTWTAVMQLAEEGRLSLDCDVNQYLRSFQIEKAFDQPVTMRHLLSHTAGFEDRYVGFLIIDDQSKVRPLAQALRDHMPARVRPPGTVAAYSNWGTALAGLIVEEVSGLEFATYAEERIFNPLGMTRTTFREPLPAHLSEAMSAGYMFAGGELKEQKFEFISNVGPGGAASSTVTDMAQFMLAHLGDGAIGDKRILREPTARQMREQLITLDPRCPGWAYGFVEQTINGHRLIGHTGSTRWFKSSMLLMPSDSFGIYVTSNSLDGILANSRLVRAVIDRFYPASAPAAVDERDQASLLQSASIYTGAYWPTNRSFTKAEKALGFGGEIRVSLVDDGLLIEAPDREAVRVKPCDTGRFRTQLGEETITFRELSNGVMCFVSDARAFFWQERVPESWTRRGQQWLIAAIIVFCTIGGVDAAVRLVESTQVLSIFSEAATLAATVAVLSFLWLFQRLVLLPRSTISGTYPGGFFNGYPRATRHLLTLPVLSIILLLVSAATLVASDFQSRLTIESLLTYFFTWAAVLLFFRMTRFWNLRTTLI